MSTSSTPRLAVALVALVIGLGGWGADFTGLIAQDGHQTVLYRVNAGGAEVSGTPSWSSDTASAPSPYSNAIASNSTTYTTKKAVDLGDPSIPAGTPGSLFQTERYPRSGGDDMRWSFPVTPGTYEVRLYFAEIYFTSVGARVFSVAIEGDPVLSNYDIVADVGAFKGVVKSFTVVADASLDITLSRLVENPKINAIEIVQASSTPNELKASPESVGFGEVVLGQTTTRTVQITNVGGSGDPNIDVYATTITGQDASEFADNFTDGSAVTLAPGQSTAITIAFTPTSTGAKTATLELSHLGLNHPLVVPLSGSGASAPPPPPPGVVYRVNAGGPAFSATPPWTADTGSSPSQYTNAAAASSKTYSATSAAINISHPSLPPGTPGQLFQTERYDEVAGSPMQWSFPVTPGTYEVRLYFAEIYHTSAGARAFNVSIGGQPVLTAYDIVADVGSFTGVMKSFMVTADASVNIAFGHVTGNPKISAIEIVTATPRPNELGVSPASLPFGSVVVGRAGAQTLQVTNLGRPGDSDIVVSGTTITGTGAGQFSDSFNDATGITLAPQQSTTMTVTFAPTETGAKSATLHLAHSGANSVGVPLSGTGAEPSSSTGTWQGLAPSSIKRHEIAYVHHNGKFYLTGDRGRLENEVYDPVTNTWGFAAPLPAEFHHAQGVELNGLIYYLGGLVGPYPDHVTDAVHIFNPTANAWSSGTPMLPGRARGGGGTAAYDGKLYVAGGLQDEAGSNTGHLGVSVSLFDVYDPVAGTWTPLPDMPRARDHFHAAVVGSKFYAIGGRKGGESGFFNAVIAPVDVYDLVTNTWSTLPASLNIPTPRAGTAVAVLGPEIVVFGGEGNGNAYNNVEAFNTVTGSWRTLTPMPTARHGIQAAVCNGGVYIAGGGLTQGGGSLTNIHQVFFLGGPAGCGSGTPPPPPPVGFGKTTLTGTTSLSNPTSLQFGPDGRLYVAQQNGLIRIFGVTRNAANSYAVSSAQVISSINTVPNHNDDGTLNPNVTTRLITGILVVGTAASPVVYVAHSDPRIGGGSSGTDLNLDTNSSMISRLTWTGSSWQKLDLVRGLPRSEENHAANGMQLDAANNILYVAMGGNTNKGATSNNFALLPEFALSAAILSIDLTAIGNATYDLPTLDDETRPGNPDANDPFGGNNGRNQARLVPGGPVQVYAPGFRNPYDLVITRSGRMYTIDNGGNAGWGHIPVGAGPQGTCTNERSEPGTTSPDSLHFITGPGYYGGHPNPTRANMANTFNTSNPQSPVSVANPIECEYREAGQASGALATFPASTNGLAAYTAMNFGGAMNGNLLAAAFNGVVYRIQLNAAGTAATQVSSLFSSVGSLPLDVVAESPFPGTIWVALYGGNQVVAFEPNDFDSPAPTCTGAYDDNLDEDLDGYTNKDEIDNGTDPCSAADVPPDWDGDFISDLNDPDDDNDGIPDELDAFALDPLNGLGTRLPVEYFWENDGLDAGGILNLGFTGLMKNNSSNYASQFDPSQMTAGGAAGVMTVDQVSKGDAYGALNSQKYGFQFGLWANPTDTGVFVAHTRILGPFAGLTPHDGQSMGLYVGTGDQDNYAKIVVSGTAGGGIAFLREVGGTPGAETFAPLALPGPAYIDLYLRVDPGRATVQPFYTATTDGVTGAPVMLALPQPVPASWFTNPAQGLAIGVISTSRGEGPEFPATWAFIRAVPSTEVPTLAVTPGVLAFDAVAVGGSQTRHVQFSHTGGPDAADLVLDGVTITGTGTAHFSHDFGPGVTLAPGETATVAVTFTPSAAGDHTAALNLWHSAAGTPFQVPLSGSGTSGGAPTLGASPASVAFGGVTVGANAALAVYLTNQGTADLVVNATTITGTHAAQFSDSFNDASPITLTPGATTAVTVTFTPASTGTKSATLSIAHTGGNTPLQVPLAGSGTAPVLPTLAAAPTSLAFGSVTVGQSAALALHLTNQGTTDLVVNATTITGTHAAQFSDSFNDASPITLTPGATTVVTVTFTPASNGAKKATLQLEHNGANTPLSVPLSGSGTKR
ncbi:MAG: choice-of-anchor D domain-containing protein [Acidobacteria bacterium]|nr:choice-of-anchor D domain-containing protein [Acidobacteriota bacterium]